MYVHAAPGLFLCGVELLASASQLFASKKLHHLLHVPFCSILRYGERSWRNRPLREVPYVRTWLYIRTCTHCPSTVLSLHIRGMMQHIYCYTPINRMSFCMTTLKFHTIKTKNMHISFERQYKKMEGKTRRRGWKHGLQRW